MQSFPMFIKTTDRLVVVIGAGEQAAQKCRLLLKSDAQILLLGDRPDAELQAMISQGRIGHKSGPITPDSFDNAIMGFIATGSPIADLCIHSLAKEVGLLVNVVDRPELCDLTTPSIVDRDPLVVAIGTEGNAPVLARRIKAQVEQMLDPNIGNFTQAVGLMRGLVARHIPQEARRGFWRDVFTGPIWQTFKRGAEREALSALKDMIQGAAAPVDLAQITVIDTSGAAADLIPLRAVERMQEADEIFYESPADEVILERARRDAERHLMGGAGADTAWPAKICVSFIQRAARPGRKVIWLKNCADPATLAAFIPLQSDPEIQFELLAAGKSSALPEQASDHA